MSKPVIAIDMGGTKIKIGIVHQDTILASASIDSYSGEGLTQDYPLLKKLWINYWKEQKSPLQVYQGSVFLHQELLITIVKEYYLWIKNSVMRQT
ncbi:hypothetical protein ACH34I_08135 [Elizabethkingia anophelis]